MVEEKPGAGIERGGHEIGKEVLKGQKAPGGQGEQLPLLLLLSLPA